MALSLKDKPDIDAELLDGIDSTEFMLKTDMSDAAYGGSWGGDTTHVPTKNAVYNALEGKQDTLTFGIANTNAVKMDGSATNGDAAFFTSSGIKSLPASSARNALSVPAKWDVIADTGWQSFPYSITYESDNVFSVPMDDGPRYPIGTRVQLTQGSPKFFVISKVGLFSGGKTTFTLDGGGIYTFTSAPFSFVSYSRVLAPMGIDNDIVAQGLWKTVRADLLPDDTDTHSLGSATHKWKDLHLSGDVDVGGRVDIAGELWATDAIVSKEVVVSQGSILATEYVYAIDGFLMGPGALNILDVVASLPGHKYIGSVWYTSSGTFKKTDHEGLAAIRVRLVGAGGAGGGAVATGANHASTGAGGGGGGYAERFVLASALAASETVTVGVGGSGSAGNNGGDGGDTSFGSHCEGKGGLGGTYNNASSGNLGAGGGGGGTATGDFVIRGQTGGSRFVSGGNAYRGYGGNSALGMSYQGGFRQTTDTYTVSSGGGLGTGYGCGGSGAMNGRNQASAAAGGGGRDGIVIIDLYA